MKEIVSLMDYRSSIKVVDATLRDGGLVNEFYFTDEFVRLQVTSYPFFLASSIMFAAAGIVFKYVATRIRSIGLSERLRISFL